MGIQLNLTVRKFADHYIPSNVKIRLIKNFQTIFEGTVEDLYWNHPELLDNIVAMIDANECFLCISCR